MQGKVVKAVASRFFVFNGEKTYVCAGRKKLRAGGNIYVGDDVEFSVFKENGKEVGVIEKVFPRKNSLIRPYVANIDMCLILLAPEPKPDMLLAEKIILNCFTAGIEPVIVVNKIDIERVDVASFKGLADVYFCSAETGEGIDAVVELLRGKTAALAGQSAVGKSAIINAILCDERLKTGGLSKKSNRGKHTTRQNELLPIDDFYIIDTCGFSLLELPEIPPEELATYYDDFLELSKDCAYKAKCMHLSEPSCAVRDAVESGKIHADRYKRYLELQKELTERKEKDKHS